jgi:hypothetical protein
MTTDNDMKEATIRIDDAEAPLNRVEATKYVDKALEGGFGTYTQELMKGACGANLK